MKKSLILILLGLLISMGGYAQKNKRTSAFMYNKNGQYEKAMNAINEAIKHPKTENDAKTWMYRGEIYYNIAKDTSALINALAPDAASISVESFKKTKSLDESKSLDGQIALYLINLTNIFYQKGAENFRSEDFNSAITNFSQAFDIAQLDDRFDTIAAFNIGMSGVYSDQPEIAAEYMKKCVDVGFNDSRVYLYYAKAEKNMGDTTSAFKILEQGREIFPEDSKLQLEQAQLFLETGENEKLISSLKESIAADPENPNFYRIIGGTYEQMGDTESALKNYEIALELKPDFGDVIYNIGAIYVNRAAVLYNEANDLPLDEMEKYNEIKEKAETNLNLALPFLEKSHELYPDDVDILNSLKEAYKNLKLYDKLESLK
jgi:tetratricopeptide (TPR) repeat protein